MSLDIYIYDQKISINKCVCDCGNVHTRKDRNLIAEFNITHNLSPMASQADIYKQVWRPDECGITTCYQMIEPLSEGIENLKKDPEKFKLLEPSNGWGSYEGLLKKINQYLQVCKKNPTAKIEVDR